MYRSHTRCCAPVGAHSGAPACFATHARSFLIRDYFCPPNPNKAFAYAHKSFIGWQPPLIVVLACGSLGLIGLSHFLQYQVGVAVFVPVVPPCTSHRNANHTQEYGSTAPIIHKNTTTIKYHQFCTTIISFGCHILAISTHAQAKSPPALPHTVAVHSPH